MQTVSSEFLASTQGSAKPVFYADIWYDGRIAFKNVRIEDGSVSFQAGQAVRGTCTVTLLDPDNTMVPTEVSSPLAPFGGVINVRAGFEITERTETVSLGWFDIHETEVTEAFRTITLPDGSIRQVPSGSRITVTGRDFMQRVIDYQFMNPENSVTNSKTNLCANSTLDANLDGWTAEFGNGSGTLARFRRRAFANGISARIKWAAASTDKWTSADGFGGANGTPYKGGPVFAPAKTVLSDGSPYTWSIAIRPSRDLTLAVAHKRQFGSSTPSVSIGRYKKVKAGKWTRLYISWFWSTFYDTNEFIIVSKDSFKKGDTLDFDAARLQDTDAPSEWSVWDEIVRLCDDVVQVQKPSFVTPEVPAGIVYDSDRFDAINTLARVCDAEPIITANGMLTLVKLVDGDLAPDLDWQVNLTGYTKRMSRDGVYNAVVATGKDSKSLTISRIAKDTSGPLAYDGPFGRHPTFFDSDLMKTSTAVQSKADDLLADVATSGSQDIPVSVLPNPAIELGDYTMLRTERTDIKARITGIEFRAQGDMNLTLSVPTFWWSEEPNV